MSTFDDIDDELLNADLHVGFPERRRELANQLLGEGLSATAVADLANYAFKTFSASKRAGGLVNLLLDRERRTVVLADLAKVARLKAVGQPLPATVHRAEEHVPAQLPDWASPQSHEDAARRKGETL